MKTILFLLAAIAVAADTAFARLGENSEEIIARYGPVVETKTDANKPDFPAYCFRLGTITVTVRFLNGLSAHEGFRREKGGLSSEDIKDILEANKQGSSWEFSSSEKYFEHYRRADGKAKAHIMHAFDGRNDDILLIVTDAMGRAMGTASKF